MGASPAFPAKLYYAWIPVYRGTLVLAWANGTLVLPHRYNLVRYLLIFISKSARDPFCHKEGEQDSVINVEKDQKLSVGQ